MNPNSEDFERIVTEVLNQSNSDISDIEDRILDENFCLEFDHDTKSELSERENEDQDLLDFDDGPLINLASNRPYYLGKNVGNI